MAGGVVSSHIARWTTTCEPSCPDVEMVYTQTTGPVTDAGQPHPIDDASTPDGLSIITAAGPTGAADMSCWSIAESNPGTSGSCGNSITDVLEVSPGNYEVTLAAPLRSRAVTTITYKRAAGTTDDGVFTALPGDVDHNDTTNTGDIDALINCLTSGVCNLWQCDVDRLGGCTGADLARLIDLLNDAGAYNGWNGATTIFTPCPPR